MDGLEGESVRGYEIHNGRTRGANNLGWLKITERGEQLSTVDDGSINDDGRVWGCYLHGLFENDLFRKHWLTSLGKQTNSAALTVDRSRPEFFDDFADQVEEALDMDMLDQIIGLK